MGKLVLGKMALGKMAGWVKWRRVKWNWVKWNWVNCHVTFRNYTIFATLRNSDGKVNMYTLLPLTAAASQSFQISKQIQI